MLDEWDSQLGSLQASDMETLPLMAAAPVVATADVACQGDAAAEEVDMKTELSEEDFTSDIFLTAETTPAPLAATPTVISSPPTTTICVRRPLTTAPAAGRGLISVSAARQLPVSNAAALRSPVISRGICYTRTGGLGVTR
jgi:hypothetical protein